MRRPTEPTCALILDTLDVIHAGSTTFPLAVKMRAVAFDRLLSDIRPLSAR